MHGKAKKSTEINGEKEIVETATVQAMGKNRHGNVEKTKLETCLNNNAGDGKTAVIENGETLVVKFIDSNRYYEIDSEGNCKEYEVITDKNPGDITTDKDGNSLDGSEIHPYQIWSIEDLVSFAQISSTINVNQYVDKYIILCRNLDFKSSLSYSNPETTEYDEFLGGDGSTTLIKQLSKEGKGFAPIVGGPFKGTIPAKQIDGQGYKIQNIYVYQSEDAGLMSKLNGIMIIKNLTVTGEITSTESNAGGISASIVGEGSKIINCHNMAKITGNKECGGIAGSFNGNIEKSYNSGTIISETQNAGGILGVMPRGGSVKNCYNEGNIKSNNEYAGGIIGNENSQVLISNCYNRGNVNAKLYAGGIIGDIYQSVKITNTYNTGKIESENNTAGGIVGGGLWNNPDNQIKYCYYLSNMEKGIGSKITDTTIKYTDSQMKNNNFSIELNSNINKYKEENPDIDTSDWYSWKIGEDGYPKFIVDVTK